AASGAVPATIAVIAGRLKVGLERADLETLAQARDVAKASGRDLAAVMAAGGHAGTTVSATMLAASLAGIKVFATGGVGGVHRGAETSFDISADLTELGRTPVAVVCAGVKSILDISKTLEYL
ncbi:pseudouridine-5'-phosphate glycosidase, partial [Mycobacterium tuberculosis]|nr:pseudouridine-5'-phosphate glycosidase [Mycobacterium tuberculosis]